MPGIIEWPGRIRAPRVSDIPVVTSDILPTLAGLTGQALSDRPLDGIDLDGLLDGTMTARPRPIFFWSFDIAGWPGRGGEPYLPPVLQEGTTPLVKLMNGIPTRVFDNRHYRVVAERDFAGPRVVLNDSWKLVIDVSPGSGTALFDLRHDPAEARDLAASHPDVVARMQAELRVWQRSTLESLTGADYELTGTYGRQGRSPGRQGVGRTGPCDSDD